jgi:hypothetical protein
VIITENYPILVCEEFIFYRFWYIFDFKDISSICNIPRFCLFCPRFNRKHILHIFCKFNRVDLISFLIENSTYFTIQLQKKLIRTAPPTPTYNNSSAKVFVNLKFVAFDGGNVILKSWVQTSVYQQSKNYFKHILCLRLCFYNHTL